MAKFIDKTALNIDHVTTAIALATVASVGGMLLSSIATHKDFGGMIQGVITAAIGALGWLQGSPSNETKKLFKRFMSEDAANSLIAMDAGAISDRLKFDLGRHNDLPDTLPHGSDRGWGSPGVVVDEPNGVTEWGSRLGVADRARAEAAKLRDKFDPPIEGADMRVSQFIKASQIGDEVTAAGAWE